MVVNSLDEVESVESLHKTELYRVLTGQEMRFNTIHDHRVIVTPESMDQVYQAVDKFAERYYINFFFKETIDMIEAAYGRREFETFSENVSILLKMIALS